MKRKSALRAVAAGIALAAASVPAAALDVKPGLWETTAHSQAHGQLPIPPEELQRMTPQQRAAIEKMEARALQPRTTVHKGCLTKEKMEKDQDAFLSESPGMKCTSKLTRQTRTAIAGTRHCEQGTSRQSEERFSFQARDREHVTGTISFTLSDSGRTMSSRGTLTGRWLGASCGKTK